MMRWHIVTSKEYANGVAVDHDMYFLSDTNEVYRGKNLYSAAVNMYDDSLPTNPAKNRLYINKTTLAGKMWDGENWIDCLKGVVDSITEDGGNPVTGRAVTQYVSGQIEKLLSNLEYDEIEHVITITNNDGSTKTITLSGLACNMTYVDNKLILLDASGNSIGDPINLDIERFVTGAEYNAETKCIYIYFDGKTGEESKDKIEIPVGELVNIYTVGSTSSISMKMVDNQITSDLKLSAAEKNAASINEDGIYVPKVEVVAAAEAAATLEEASDEKAASEKLLASMFVWKTSM